MEMRARMEIGHQMVNNPPYRRFNNPNTQRVLVNTNNIDYDSPIGVKKEEVKSVSPNNEIRGNKGNDQVVARAPKVNTNEEFNAAIDKAIQNLCDIKNTANNRYKMDTIESIRHNLLNLEEYLIVNKLV